MVGASNRTCPVCGKQFTPWRAKQYCSEKCANAGKRAVGWAMQIEHKAGSVGRGRSAATGRSDQRRSTGAEFRQRFSAPRGTSGAWPSTYLTLRARPTDLSMDSSLRARTRCGFVPFVQRARQRTQADRGSTLP